MANSGGQGLWYRSKPALVAGIAVVLVVVVVVVVVIAARGKGPANPQKAAGAVTTTTKTGPTTTTTLSPLLTTTSTVPPPPPVTIGALETAVEAQSGLGAGTQAECGPAPHRPRRGVLRRL